MGSSLVCFSLYKEEKKRLVDNDCIKEKNLCNYSYKLLQQKNSKNIKYYKNNEYNDYNK